MPFTLFQEGRIIPRIMPSDVTTNIGKDEVVPKCPGDERYHGTF